MAPPEYSTLPRSEDGHDGHQSEIKGNMGWKNVVQESETDKSGDYSFGKGFHAILFTGPLNILLLCTPIALASYALKWNDAITFVFSLLAIAPFAERLGFCTEQLALHTNETIGGLLNATFGNATELIVAISALSKGLHRVVQLSLLGSILSNMLLVLGTAFLCGGLKFKIQKYNTISSQVNSSILMLGTMAILFPTILSQSNEENHGGEVLFSRGVSVILFLTYLLFLLFQLYTHKDIYDEAPSEPSHHPRIQNSNEKKLKNGEITHSPMDVEAASRKISPFSIELSPDDQMREETLDIEDSDDVEENEDEDEDILGVNYSIFWLSIITIFIAFLSDALASTIERAATNVKISGVFLSGIVLPIVGNAAEHASAIIFAMRGKMDLALGVAIGSATQIALFVFPLLVIIGWFIGQDLSLNLNAFEAYSLFLSVIIVTFVIKDGSSNWIVGAVLMMAYFVVSAGFLTRYDENLA